MGVSDHIVAIDAGRELAQGNPAQIPQSPAVRQADLGDQAARRAPAARLLPAGAPIAPEVLGVGNLVPGYGADPGLRGIDLQTLLGALASELPPASGPARLDGAALAAMPHREQARRRAVLPQKPGLTFDLDVREVVAMGAYPFPELPPGQVDALVTQALELADVAHLGGRRYPELSGGEQQRVQFARVLVQCHAARAPGEARYLLLDEPTASLDPKHQGDLLGRAWELAHAGNTGVLVILHDMNLAARWYSRRPTCIWLTGSTRR
ncbi:hypothetical protein G6F31_015982 [Rhizopus arrhizus]|nr:hypothetical protein G6F31_015982 [Rhizopus arrhizus]